MNYLIDMITTNGIKAANILLIFTLLTIFPFQLFAELNPEQVAGSLSRPWSLAFLPDGDFLVTLRTGSLLRIEPEGSKHEIAGLPPIASAGQGGLLDIILHPDFKNNRIVLFSYSFSSPGGFGTAVARARFEDDKLHNVQDIFRMSDTSSTTHHFGSRIVFEDEQTILFTIGDRGSRHSAQDLGDERGKVHRIHLDGSVPANNPFGTSVYTWGHRNAQGLAVQPETGVIWLHEHGPKGGDEVNILTAGANYGWPVITYGEEYRGGEIGEGVSKPGMVQPEIYWSPSIAPSGMTFYTGSRYPGWEGDLFVGALAGTHLRRIEIDGKMITDQEVLLDGKVGRIRDVRTGPDGYLYILTDAANGRLYRLLP
jgi:aldose sugar dehydrogenase